MTSSMKYHSNDYSLQQGDSVHLPSGMYQSNLTNQRQHCETLLKCQSSMKAPLVADESGAVRFAAEYHGQPRPTHTERRYNCNQCSYQTSYRHNLRRHKRVHSGDFFHCHLCTCHFSDSYRLKLHLRVHAAKLMCGVCGKHFVTHDGLARHSKTH